MLSASYPAACTKVAIVFGRRGIKDLLASYVLDCLTRVFKSADVLDVHLTFYLLSMS